MIETIGAVWLIAAKFRSNVWSRAMLSRCIFSMAANAVAVTSPRPTCGCVSESSFGHTGFTGNMAWVDPETEIVYVFLSNRTYPEVVNDENKLAKGKIREEIQKIIQEAIIK